jgi:hypothetical protein
MDQGTAEWFAARLGKVTASKVSDVMSKTKTGYGAGRETYMSQLIAEILTGKKAEGFSNAAMAWGTETEPFARMAYEALNNVLVDEMGFAPHPTIERAGASPDGLVGQDGLIEIKCPNTTTHLDTMIEETIPKKYHDQMQFQMACTGRKWCDFVSFDNRLPEDLQIFVMRINRNNEYIAEMEAAIIKFLAEMQEKIEKLTQMKAING